MLLFTSNAAAVISLAHVKKVTFLNHSTLVLEAYRISNSTDAITRSEKVTVGFSVNAVP